MRLLGIIIIANSLIVTGYWVSGAHQYKGWVVSVCVLAIFVGLIFTMHDRAIEITFERIGTIKAAAEQANADADDIAAIKKRIESQSATIDLVANEASQAKTISEEVAKKNQLAEEKLDMLDQAITKATATLAEIDASKEFTLTVLNAQSDDRKAYDTLKKWAENKTYRFSSQAAQAWNTIFESHNAPMYLSNFTVPWKEGFDPSKLSLSDLAQQYHGAQTQLKPAILEYIWKRDDIPKVRRLDFMMDIMKTDASLTAVEYAGRHFTSGTELKIKPMAVEYLAEWWEAHKHEFEG